MNIFDHWIQKLEGTLALPPEESLSVTAENINSLLAQKENSFSKVGIAGTIAPNRLRELYSLLESAVSVETVYVGNVNSDPDAVKALRDCDGIILVEQCRYSLLTHVTNEVHQIALQDVPVIGYILVDRWK